VIAIWYGVSARTATIVLHSALVFWEPHQVRLTPGKVTTLRSHMQRLPSVRVSVTTTDRARLPDSMSITIHRASDDVTLASEDTTFGEREIANLPAELLRVTLRVGEWQFSEQVDLSSGADQQVRFELEPIVVSGTVFLGNRGVRAELAFHNAKDWVRVQTDDEGGYETTLWYPGDYTIRIDIPEDRRAPLLEPFTRIEKSGRHDFHVPDGRYVVNVKDAASGGPLQAHVGFGNIWLDADRQERTVRERVDTDDRGRAALPGFAPARCS
jgi:hypothetical protein